MRWTSILVLCLLGCGSEDPQTDPPVDSGVAAETGVDVGSSDAAEGGAAVCTEVPLGEIAKVTVAELKAVIDTGKNVAVVDVREPSETAKGVIAGALLYPWVSGVLKAKHAELPTDRPLYVLCASGTRSALATDFLSKNGHGCIHDTQGGMNAWTAAKYPTVTP